ncbi:MAG: hypothetical protein IJW38_01930 [Clostridia bacterium]|nr:hypothetical protein [Clostridia bacterium]
MKKIISLALAILFFASNIFFLFSCGGEEVPPPASDSCSEHTDVNNDGTCDVCNDTLPKKDENDGEIKVPEYKDYLRGTKNFGELVYSRPDIDAALSLIDSLCAMISENVLPYEEQLAKLDEIEAVYTNVKSMNSIATIYNYKDTSSELWQSEYIYITTNYPKFTQGIEKLFVSAANSPHIESFERDFFGDGLEEYINGGVYSDTVVELMKKEAELEAKYSSLSTANVIISYNGITDTYDNIIAQYKEKYGEQSTEFLKARTLCDSLYEDEVSKLEAELLVELIKARKLISDALGYESYEKFAYENIYHDYAPKDMENFIESVTETVIPVYLNLSKKLFSPYIYDYEKTVSGYKVKKSELINTLYDVYTACDSRLGEIYSYMLQHSLFDIESEGRHRFNASFTTYIESNFSPFLFVTLDNSILDYATLAHEFGHFADAYINNDSSASLDLLELSSQGLELLTLAKFNDKFDGLAYKYLLYMKLDEILSTIIFQSFYASFEINAYKLDYEDITLESLNSIVASVAKDFGFSASCNSVEYVAIPHLFLYPFYVQSYATSAAAALEIYTIESQNAGAGFAIYNYLIERNENTGISFEDTLKSAGLTSPFEKNALKNILNELHYVTLGAYYYKSHDGNAA